MLNMEISVIATTHPDYQSPKKELDRFGGMAAGVCYMAHDFATLRAEDEEKTFRRVEMTKPCDHYVVFTLYPACVRRDVG